MSIPECRRLDFLPALVEPRGDEVHVVPHSESSSLPATANFVGD